MGRAEPDLAAPLTGEKIAINIWVADKAFDVVGGARGGAVMDNPVKTG